MKSNGLHRLGLMIVFLSYLPKPLMGQWSLSASYIGSYHSNLLNYSPRDRDLFLKGMEVSPSPIRSLDDFRSDLRINLRVDRLWKKKIRMRGRLTLNYASFLMNPIKNFGWLSGSLEGRFSRSLTLYLQGFYEPRYYIRHYRDSHTGQREPTIFSLGWGGGGLQYTLPYKIYVDMGMRYKIYRYNKYFTEYDGEGWEPTIEFSRRWEGTKIAVNYGFTHFTNTGFNPQENFPIEAFGEDSEIGQGDYQEDSWGTIGERRVQFWGREFIISLSGGLRQRYYTTTRSSNVDPIHSQRRDRIWEGNLSLKTRWNPQWGGEISMGGTKRNSQGDSTLVAEIKSYENLSISFRIDRYFR